MSKAKAYKRIAKISHFMWFEFLCSVILFIKLDMGTLCKNFGKTPGLLTREHAMVNTRAFALPLCDKSITFRNFNFYELHVSQINKKQQNTRFFNKQLIRKSS